MSASRRLETAGLLAALFLGSFPAAVGADDPPPPPPEVRAHVEEAFHSGQLSDLDAALGDAKGPVAEEPRRVRDLFWRPPSLRPAVEPVHLGDPADASVPLSVRRGSWLDRWSLGADLEAESYPVPGPADGDDPYPLLTALVRDRVLRETRGAEGLPDRSPLAKLTNERVRFFVDVVARPAYLGPERASWTEEAGRADDDARARVDDRARKNLWIAAGAALALVVLALAAAGRGRGAATGS